MAEYAKPKPKPKPVEIVVGAVTLLALIVAPVAIFFYWMDAVHIQKSGEKPDDAELRRIEAAIVQYRALYGVFPAGDSRKVAGLLELKGGELNDEGELLDSWRRPYKIWCSSKGRFVIHSAGENGTFGDGDDLVISRKPVAGSR